ncbi:MAG: hypothetical protein AAFW83_14670 [Pseudomonadota bacterium]
MRFVRIPFVYLALVVLALSGCSEPEPTAEEKAALAAAEEQRQLENAFYFRIKVDYIEKANDLPFSINYVAACNITTEPSGIGGGRSVRGRVVPEIMIAPLPSTKEAGSGPAIGIFSIDACSGSYLKYVPDNAWPYTVVFDDAEKLWYSWGYATEQAYESERSLLTFVESSVTRATYQDWLDWRAHAEANWKPIGNIPGPYGYSYNFSPTMQAALIKKQDGRDVARTCSSMARIKLPNEVFEKILEKWPEDNRQYWAPNMDAHVDRPHDGDWDVEAYKKANPDVDPSTVNNSPSWRRRNLGSDYLRTWLRRMLVEATFGDGERVVRWDDLTHGGNKRSTGTLTFAGNRHKRYQSETGNYSKKKNAIQYPVIRDHPKISSISNIDETLLAKNMLFDEHHIGQSFCTYHYRSSKIEKYQFRLNGQEVIGYIGPLSSRTDVLGVFFDRAGYMFLKGA